MLTLDEVTLRLKPPRVPWTASMAYPWGLHWMDADFASRLHPRIKPPPPNAAVAEEVWLAIGKRIFPQGVSVVVKWGTWSPLVPMRPNRNHVVCVLDWIMTCEPVPTQGFVFDVGYQDTLIENAPIDKIFPNE